MFRKYEFAAVCTLLFMLALACRVSAADIYAVLGSNPQSENLAISGADETAEYNGKSGIKLYVDENGSGNGYLYADVNDDVAYDISDYTNVTVSVTYYDGDYGWFKLMYDSLAGAQTRSELVYLENTGEWKTHSFRLDRAAFSNFCKKNDFVISVADPSAANSYLKRSSYPVVISRVDVNIENTREYVSATVANSRQGNVFYSGETPEFNVSFKNRLGKSSSFRAVYSVYDYGGSLITQSSDEFSINSRETLADRKKIEINKFGLYILKVEISNSDGLYSVSETKFSYCIKNSFVNSSKGICHDWNWDASEIPLIKNAGFGIVRVTVPWSAVESNAGEYTINPSYDEFINTLIENQIEPLVILGVENYKYISNSDKPHSIVSNNAGLEAYRKYCEFVAHYFKGRVRKYEVWNEPDMCNSSKTAGYINPTDEQAYWYAEMIKAAYGAVKNEDETAEISVLSMARAIYGGISWAQTVLEKLNGEHCFDKISLHMYTGETTPEWRNLPERLENWRSMAREQGYDAESFVFTEFGFSTDTGAYTSSVTEEMQAAYAVRENTIFDGDSLKHQSLLYCFADPGNSLDYKEDCFGIVKSRTAEIPLSAKPAYAALAAFNNMTNGAIECAKMIGTHGGGADGSAEKFVYKYKLAMKDVYVCWAEKTTALIEASFFGENTVFYDIYGNRIEPDDGTLELSAIPVYAVTDYAAARENFADGNVRIVCAADGRRQEENVSFVAFKPNSEADENKIESALYINEYTTDENGLFFPEFNAEPFPGEYTAYYSNGEKNKIKFTVINSSLNGINIYKGSEKVESLTEIQTGEVITATAALPEKFSEAADISVACYSEGVLKFIVTGRNCKPDEFGFVKFDFTIPDKGEFDALQITAWNSLAGMVPIATYKKLV